MTIEVHSLYKSWAGSDSVAIKTVSQQNTKNVRVKSKVNVDRALEVIDRCTVLLIMRYFIRLTLF